MIKFKIILLNRRRTTKQKSVYTIDAKKPRFPQLHSGSSEHYAPLTVPCSNKRPCLVPYTVSLPDQREICATHTAVLDLPWLPPGACKAYLFKELTDRDLVSVAQFCDNGFNVVFTKK